MVDVDGLGEKGSHLLRCVLSCAVCELSSGPGYIHRPPPPPTTILTICPPSLIRRVAHSSTVPISQPPHPSPVYSLCTRDVLFFFASFYCCCCCCCGWVVRRFFVCFRFFFFVFFRSLFSVWSFVLQLHASALGRTAGQPVGKMCSSPKKKNKCKKRTPHTHTHRHNIVVTQNRAKEMGQTRPRHSAFGGCHRNLCRRSPSRPLGVFSRWPCGTRTRVRESEIEGVSKKKKNDPQMKRNFTVGFCCCCCCRGASDHRNPAHWSSVHFRATTRARGRLIVSFGWLWV